MKAGTLLASGGDREAVFGQAVEELLGILKEREREIQIIKDGINALLRQSGKPHMFPVSPELDEGTVSRVMKLLGSKGGKRGGLARAASLTPEERREISRNAALIRWAKEREK